MVTDNLTTIQSLREAYAAGLERAAEIAEARGDAFKDSSVTIACEAHIIAETIRAEKEKTDGTA
jgi:hypothetical protein